MILLFYCNESVLTSSSRNIYAETCKKWLFLPNFKCATVSRHTIIHVEANSSKHRFSLDLAARVSQSHRIESGNASQKRSKVTKQTHLFMKNSWEMLCHHFCGTFRPLFVYWKWPSLKHRQRNSSHMRKDKKGSLAEAKSWFLLRTTSSKVSFFYAANKYFLLTKNDRKSASILARWISLR